MEWLNYHHLYYFWVVAREGSIAAATRELGLAQPTVSSQLHQLEASLGEKLFTRAGRGLSLTEVGRVVYAYASDIFALGSALKQTLKGGQSGRQQLNVGVTEVLPKLIAHELLRPALELSPPVRLSCREDRQDRLLAALSIHELDVVLADAPIDASIRVHAYNHLLGECGVAIYGIPSLARRYRADFPRSLSGAPMLLPFDGTTLRRSLDHFFAAEGIKPQVVGDFDDSALLKVFGESGLGLFPGPSIMAAQIRRQYRCVVVGELPSLRERFFAISIERRIKHPAIAAICQAARERLFPRLPRPEKR